MKLLNCLTRIVCASALIAITPYAFAGSFSHVEAQKILDQNPQLKSSGVLPTNMRVLGGDQCREFSDGEHSRSSDAFRASLKGVTFNHTCIQVESDKGFKAYEKGYGDKRFFRIVLHLDTPKVWRVYETKDRRKGDPPDVSKLAEFDINGKRVAVPTSDTSRQAEQIVNSQSSPQARSVAEQGATNPTDNSALPALDESTVESAVKKGIGDFFKGLGR